MRRPTAAAAALPAAFSTFFDPRVSIAPCVRLVRDSVIAASAAVGPWRSQLMKGHKSNPDVAAAKSNGASPSMRSTVITAMIEGRRRLSDVDPQALSAMLDARLGWDGRKRLDAMAPEMFETPAGTRHVIDYDADGGPEVEVRVQALFGLTEHPCIGPGRMPIRLSLTSPAGRPIQTTSDLPAFWTGSWRDVAKEMRGRYPRHNWPENPAEAPASLRTKRAQGKS